MDKENLHLIFKTYNIKEEYYSLAEDFAKRVIDYDNYINNIIPNTISMNLLPLNLKIFSNLDFKKVDINFVNLNDDIDTYKFSEDVKNYGVGDINISMVEDSLILQIIEFINSCKKVDIYLLLSSISIKDKGSYIRVSSYNRMQVY